MVEGLEMLLPDLDLGDQKKLVIEDIEDETEETIMKTDCDNFRYEVTKNFVCNLCLTHFSSKQKRDNHIENMHSKKKRFSSKVCAKIIYSKDGLVSHMNKHTRFFGHQCLYCQKSYKNESDLLKHVSSNHPRHGTEETRKFECSECYFTTKRVDSLYRHERNVHGLYNKNLDAISATLKKKGEVKCSKCDKKFTDPKQAKEHFLQESCDLIKCKDCGKVFKKREDLELHIRDVHTESNFSCPSCNKIFKQKRNMNRHHQKCKLKETDKEEISKKAAPKTTKKINEVIRNKRKQLSKTDIKKLTKTRKKISQKGAHLLTD